MIPTPQRSLARGFTIAKQTTIRGLRILAADEDESTLRQVDALLAQLGHTVTAHAVTLAQAAQLIASEEPDLSVVAVHDDDEHALELIEEIAEYASGPVVALLGEHRPQFVSQAAARGIDAFARPRNLEEVQGAIEVAMHHHAQTLRLTEQVEQLESAIDRRGTIERAKGILMERHSADERAAFELLRDNARKSSRRVVEIAQSVVDGHALLPRNGGGA
ncbi:MAG: two-component system, response regulator PdtaR [Solirubrobacteraceae bacterium]|nr:two-component system, response regulator PdtaR [Solirubrobacteraceae bacterium]